MAGLRRIIDLSVPIENTVSEPRGPIVRHQTHAETAPEVARIFGCAVEDLPGGLGWGNDQVELGAHAGTHVDSPWHYYPTSEGRPARTIDQLPLDWFIGDGVVLDFRAKERGSVIGVPEIQAELARIGYALKPRDIVLLHTGTDKLWGTPEYFDAGCGLGREATLWLCDQGIKVIGTDAWGLDRPFWAIRRAFQQTHDPSVLWAAHRVGIDREYCQIEKLANLDQLPRPFGFTVVCLPVKLAGGSAGWTRCVAIVEQEEDAT
jgi:kynurenine formamidase